MRRTVLAALAAASSLLAPVPAPAQQPITVCVVNSAGFVMNTRFEYTDWRGQRHESAWVRSAIGGRNCARVQDLRSMRVRVNMVIFTDNNHACNVVIDPPRTATIQVSGTIWNPTCATLG
ncbi:MAG: hypothetical protein K2X11_05350 [Acetobacteraceae bacterium]|nr:hypothetical protein [Acetobacteraceae bacterium]